ncbi:MAG: LytTR family DNA-binding domain-containing protein [Bacteroidota bacterium]
MYKALIIDDIDNCRLTLKQDLQDYCPSIEVIGEADGVQTGIIQIASKQPDVVFLDIQMKDGTGFDMLEKLGEFNFQVIFTTALDSFGIKAIKFSALDYLLKPVDPDELVKAVGKLAAVSASKQTQDSISLLLENMKDIKPDNRRIALSSAEKIHMVYVKDIIRCESQGAYTLFYLVDGTQILVTKNLKEFELLLEEYAFVRVHHSHLINFSYLKEYIKKEGGYAIMTDDTHVPVSFRKRTKLLEMIGHQ